MTKGSGLLSCRFCGSPLRTTFVDLGMSPLCQTHIAPEQLNSMEPFYPLHAYLCDTCFLVQLGEYVSPEDIFTEYAYFSSYADTWVNHVKNYAYEMTKRLGLGKQSSVIEVASNDGYLLQFFVEQGIPVLGIEPAANVANPPSRRAYRRSWSSSVGKPLPRLLIPRESRSPPRE